MRLNSSPFPLSTAFTLSGLIKYIMSYSVFILGISLISYLKIFSFNIRSSEVFKLTVETSNLINLNITLAIRIVIVFTYSFWHISVLPHICLHQHFSAHNHYTEWHIHPFMSLCVCLFFYDQHSLLSAITLKGWFTQITFFLLAF